MGDFVDEYYKEKDLSLLKKLTLVIPTHNRNYYLSRCLWYHAHFPFGQIIVADSSPEEKKVVNRDTVSKVREKFGSNILYLEYQPETDKYGEEIYRKWADAVFHVSTDYTKICTDKEFILPETALHSILFLDEHLDYNTADGSSLILRNISDESGTTTWDSWQPKDKSYEDEDPVKRIQDAYNNLKDPIGKFNCLTAIRRTDFQKWIYDELMKRSLIDIRFGDNMPQLLSILCSKRKQFPEYPGLVRDLSHLYASTGKKIRAESSASRYPTYIDYLFDGTMMKKIDSFTNFIVSILRNTKRYSQNELSKYSTYIVFDYLSYVTGIPLLSKMKWIYSSSLIKSFYSKMPPLLSHKILDFATEFRRIRYGNVNYAPIHTGSYGCLKPIEKLIKITFPFHDTDEQIQI